MCAHSDALRHKDALFYTEHMQRRLLRTCTRADRNRSAEGLQSGWSKGRVRTSPGIFNTDDVIYQTQARLNWTVRHRQTIQQPTFICSFFLFSFFHHHNSPDKSQHLWSEKKQREESYCCSVERNQRLIVKLSSSYTVFKSIYTMYRTDKLHSVYI